MTMIPSIDRLSDAELLSYVQRAAHDERQTTTHLVTLLAALDVRKAYLAEGYSSLFTYCTQALHFGEHAALLRIDAARAARRFPVILERLAAGDITLTSVRLLKAHLTDENHLALLDEARHQTKFEVEKIVARLSPRPDVPSRVRKLPERKPKPAPTLDVLAAPPAEATVPPPATVAPPPAAARAEIKPVSEERYKVQFTVNRATYDKLRRAQDLLRHAVPNGDPAAIVDRALTLLVAELEKKKLAATERPRAAKAESRSRYVPSAVRREVATRDGGRHALAGTQGRCTETGFLEFHHLVPFAAGGKTTAENLQLRCRAHNRYEAAQYFGPGEWLFADEAPD